jgi:ATP-dependent DNA helicase RecQ
VDKEQLYDFLLRYPQAERVLKGLLRLMGGIMNNQLNFNEQQLANFLKITVSDLEKTLKWLHTEGVLAYRVRKDKPQLTWLLPRQDKKDLSIDRALYEFRRKRHEFRLKRALEYAELPICRSKQLLHYFGQVDAPSCGACDVCLERKNELSGEELTRLSEKIRLLLRHETLTLQEIADAFAEKNREKMLRVVEFMLDNQHISKTNGKFFLKK